MTGFAVTVVLLLIVAFVAALGFAGWATIGMAAKDEKRVKALEADPGPELAGLFDGSQQVVYAPHDRSGGLTTPTLVKVAAVHGYRLTAETGVMALRQVVFDRNTAPNLNAAGTADSE